MKRLLILALAAAGSAWGQFELYLVNINIEQPVAQAYSAGYSEPGAPLSVPFRIRNVSAKPATLDLLSVNGAGFAFASQPSIPVVLASQQALDFTVVFQAAAAGAYSASLESVGISVILSAIVPVELTCQLVAGSTVQPCAGPPIDFGAVTLGNSTTGQIVLLNQTSTVLVALTPLLSGAGFALAGPSPGGTVLPPFTSVRFTVQFTPTAAGAAAGVLTLDSRSYPLTATGVAPPLPQPRISIALAQSASAQQGIVTVNLDAPAQTSGTGIVTLAFSPAATLAAAAPDPGIVFASGAQSATFTVAPGDTQGHFGTAVALPFATGTTAGAVTVAVQLGGNSDRQSILIAPASVGVTGVSGVRSAGAVELDLTGFDNTRTAGALAFTFYDASGNPIGQAIPADGAGAFASYFQSAAGGTFTLKAVFPVTGDTSQIAAFQAAVTNSAGTATARASF